MESGFSNNKETLRNTLPASPFTDGHTFNNLNLSNENEIKFNEEDEIKQKNTNIRDLNTEIVQQYSCNSAELFHADISIIPSTFEKHPSVTECYQLNDIKEESDEDIESQKVNYLDENIEMRKENQTVLSEIIKKSEDETIAEITNCAINNAATDQQPIETCDNIYEAMNENITTEISNIRSEAATYTNKCNNGSNRNIIQTSSLYEMLRQSTKTHLIAGASLIDDHKEDENFQMTSKEDSKKEVNVTISEVKKENYPKVVKNKISSSRSKSFGSLNIKPHHTISVPQKRTSIDISVLATNPLLKSTSKTNIKKISLPNNIYSKISKPPLVKYNSTFILTNSKSNSNLPVDKRHSAGEIMNRIKPQLSGTSKENLESEFIRFGSQEILNKTRYGRDNEPNATVDIIFIEKSQLAETNEFSEIIDLKSDQENNEDTYLNPEIINIDKDNLEIETGKTTEMESEISPSLDQSVELSELMKNETEFDKISDITEKEFSEISEMAPKQDLEEDVIIQANHIQEGTQKEEILHADQTEIIDKSDAIENDSELETLTTFEENDAKKVNTKSYQELENNDFKEANNDIKGSELIIQRCLEIEEHDDSNIDTNSHDKIEIENNDSNQQEAIEEDIVNDEIEVEEKLSSEIVNPKSEFEVYAEQKYVCVEDDSLFVGKQEINISLIVVKSLLSEMISKIFDTVSDSPHQSLHIINAIINELVDGIKINLEIDPFNKNDQVGDRFTAVSFIVDIIYEVIDKICCVKDLSHQEHDENQEINESQTSHTSLPNKLNLYEDENPIDTLQNETVAESKQPLQELDTSLPVELNLSPKIEGKKMRINQRPTKKEIKIEKDNSKKLSTAKETTGKFKPNFDRKRSTTKVLNKSQRRLSFDLENRRRKESISRKLSDMTLDKLNRDFSEVKSDTISDPENNEDLDLTTEKVPGEIFVKVNNNENEFSEDHIDESEKNVTIENKSTEATEDQTVVNNDVEALEQPNEPENIINEPIAAESDDIHIPNESQIQLSDETNKANPEEKELKKPVTKPSNDEDIITVIKRRLSLNQPPTVVNETDTKPRSISTTTKPRPLKRYASLVELSLKRTNKNLTKSNEECKNTDDIKEECQIEKNFSEETETKLNLEKEKEENDEIVNKEEIDKSFDAPLDKGENFINQNEIKVTTVLKEECNENEMNEDRKSKMSSVHTVTIEVRDETSEMIGESDVLITEENKPWIIDNWDCNPNMNNDDENKEETIKEFEEIQKPLLPIIVNDIKFELRKKIKTTNYKPAPVENYFTKPADRRDSKPEKPDSKAKVEVKHENFKKNTKENPIEPLEKKTENSFTKLNRTKLKEPILVKAPQKKFNTDETQKIDKSVLYSKYNDLEFRRIKSNIETLKSHIENRKQKPKEHVPFIFNDLQPYGDTNMYEKFRHQKPKSASGAVTRMTAMDLCEPWESYEMDKIILPPIRVSSSYLSSRSPQLSKRSARPDKSATKNNISHRSDLGYIEPIKEPSKSFIYSERKTLRYKNQSNPRPLPSSRIEDDYNKTKTDLYRLSLNRINSSKSIRSKSAIRSALFAYLQNSPGSRRALYEVIHNIDKEQ